LATTLIPVASDYLQEQSMKKKKIYKSVTHYHIAGNTVNSEKLHFTPPLLCLQSTPQKTIDTQLMQTFEQGPWQKRGPPKFKALKKISLAPSALLNDLKCSQ